MEAWGTSKFWVCERNGLKIPGFTVGAVLLRFLRALDPRQIDGVGGSSSEPGIDVDSLMDVGVPVRILSTAAPVHDAVDALHQSEQERQVSLIEAFYTDKAVKAS